jgi:hypothetical protein
MAHPTAGQTARQQMFHTVWEIHIHNSYSNELQMVKGKKGKVVFN